MKKMYKYILIITLMMFGFMGEVRAEVKSICEYNTKDGDKIEIKHSSSGVYKGYNVYVNDVFMSSVDWEEGSYNEFTRECPKNVYKGDTALNARYCFDTNGKYCNEANGYEYGGGLIELKDDVKNVYVDGASDNKYGLHIPESSKTTSRPTCETNKNCAPICHYSFTVKTVIGEKKHEATIYYYKGENIENRYKVSSSWIDSKRLKNLQTFNNYTAEAFISNSALLKLMDEGICPANIYKDNDGNDQVCFDNSGECMGQSKFKDHEMQDAETSFFTKKEDYLNDIKNDRKYELTCETAKTMIEEESGLENITEICGYTKIDVFSSNVKQFFVVTENNNFKFYRYSAKVGETGKFEEIENTKKNIVYDKAYTCTSFKQFYTDDVTINSQWRTDEDAANIDHMYLFTCNVGSPMGYDKIDNNITDCDSLLGEDLRNEINSWLLYIKIAVPIILIVMGSLDFGKAFISSSEDEMKKAQKKFIMRLIIALVIFFIPALVNILLNIADQVWNISNGNGTCQIKF